MRPRLLVLAVLVAASALPVVGCSGEDGVGPEIDRMEPDSASPGTAVEIIGKRFCGDGDDAATDEGTCTTPPAGFVNFGPDADVVRATIVEWKHERITVDVPQSAAVGATLVVVTVNGVSSNAVEFEVL
jgi:uncharacterized protein (TIGR03437 family)